MPSNCTVNILRDQDVEFDDLTALNQDLNDLGHGGVQELMDGCDVDEFVVVEDGKVKFFDYNGKESQEYGGTDPFHRSEGCEVWGCFNDGYLQPFADHMTKGELVVQFLHEGGNQSIKKVTPNKVEDFV